MLVGVIIITTNITIIVVKIIADMTFVVTLCWYITIITICMLIYGKHSALLQLMPTHECALLWLVTSA